MFMHNTKNKLQGVKNIIDAEAYSGGILERAKEAAISDNSEETLEEIKIASRCKKGHKKSKASRRK